MTIQNNDSKIPSKGTGCKLSVKKFSLSLRPSWLTLNWSSWTLANERQQDTIGRPLSQRLVAMIGAVFSVLFATILEAAQQVVRALRG